MISVILFKMSKHSAFHLIFFQIEGAWQDFTVATKLIKHFKSLYGFGGRSLENRDVCMDFEPYFKVHNLVSVYPKSSPKSIILGQMINLNMTFYVVVSISWFLKIWNSPQFPAEFWNGQLLIWEKKSGKSFSRNLAGVMRGGYDENGTLARHTSSRPLPHPASAIPSLIAW